MNTALEPQSQFFATLKLTSDWHIGLGAGRPGEIDRLIQRDTAGLPFIPAKTLTGIWRDACETVALGLDNHQAGPWTAWVMYLFGEQPAIAKREQVQNQTHPPRAAALSIRPASFSDSFKQAINGNQPLLAAMTFVKPGIAINAKTGTAKDNFLRFEEMARAGATLQAQCELSLEGLEPAQQKAAYCLLKVSTQLMTRLGGKRRRGAGGCELSIEGAVTEWLNWLRDNPVPAAPPEIETLTGNDLPENNPQWETAQDTNQSANQSASQPAEWTSVPLRITTQSPLVIACRTLGNVVETLDYIPGSHLLRLIMKRLRPLGVNLGQAIAHQELLITNATLEIQNQRGLPVPLALSGTKLGGGLKKGGTIFNRLIEETPDQVQLKKEQGGYLIPGEGETLPPFATVGKAVITHNTVDDAVQRPTQAVGGVYSYQAIVPGTTFRAELRIPSRLAAQLQEQQADWWNSLTGEARLGQSKKDSYGQVILTALEPKTAAPAAEISSSNNQRLTVWLLSDLLIRDQRLRPSTSVVDFAQVLSKRLGCQLTHRPLQDSEQTDLPEALPMFARNHRIESWQVRWGLPRPSLTGLAAGSCFVFDVVDSATQIDPIKLAEIAVQGIGDRCAEGFGQVSFNASLLTQPTSELKASEQTSQTSVTAQTLLLAPTGNATPEITYARCIEKAAWRDAIQKAAEALTVTSEERKQCVGFSVSIPGMSQLGSLRSVLARLRAPQQQTLTTWLERIRDKRADKWPPDSLAKLDTLFKDQNEIWRILGGGLKVAAMPPFNQLLLVDQDDSWLRAELWAEAVQTLMATAMRAHKRAIEETLDENDNNLERAGGTSHGTAA